MKKLVALVAVYLVAWGASAFAWLTFTETANAHGRRVVALGEEHAAELVTVENQPDLRDACKGKLEPGGTRSLVGYVAKAAKTVSRPADDNTWDEVVLGINHVFDDDLVRVRASAFEDVPFTYALTHNANPVDWKRHLTWAKAGTPELSATRYVVVAKYLSLTLPQNQGTDGYTRGGGDYVARVVTFPEGKVVCQGRGEVHMKETVSASGRAATKEVAQEQALAKAAQLVPFVFSLSVTTSPLHALCDAGGEALCRLTEQSVGR